jgi:hypothetical protein
VTSLDEMGVHNAQPDLDLALKQGLDRFLFSLEGR